jgi:glycosyltransferase involved in cell wall biosynthesis
MRVVMGIRGDCGAVPGGDVVQMEKTGAELERMGCRMDYRAGVLGDLTGVDLVHVFNTTRIDDTYRMLRQAQAAHRPVVVSTIWHSMREMARAYGEIHGLKPFPIWSYTALKEIYYARRAGQPWGPGLALGYRRRLHYVISTADAVLPNSQAELEALEEETGCRARMTAIIPNGYEHRAGSVPMPWATRRDIVCAGRIEPRKNQVRLARVFSQASLPAESRLCFYGAALPQAKRYRMRLERELVAGRSEYGGKLPQPELYAKYAAARVTVLASYFETTGLSALEGLAHGSAVVVTDSPCTREYFGDKVHYCDPFSDASITRAIEQAWRTPPADSSQLLERFTWKEAGRTTFAAYQKVLAAHCGHESS